VRRSKKAIGNREGDLMPSSRIKGLNKILKFIMTVFLVLLLFPGSYLISQTDQKEVIDKADLFLDMMEYKSAILNYMKILSKDPKQRDIRKNIGYAHFKLEKINDALNYLREELKLFPDNEDAYDLLVYVLFKSDRIQENHGFLENLDLHIQEDKESPNAGLGDFILGTYFKEIESYDKVTNYFRKALERGHDPVKCYVQLVDMYLIHIEKGVKAPVGGMGKVVLNECKKAIGGTPSEIHFILGLRYFEKSKTDISAIGRSIYSFEIASELKPDIDLTDALFNLACIYYNHNDFEKAAEYFRRILKVEPEDTEVRFYLYCCLKKLNKPINEEIRSEQWPKRVSLSREFIDKPDREYKFKPKNDSFFVLQNINNVGLEFIKRNKFPEALKRFRNGLKIYPESPQLNLNMAIVYSWLNNLEAAEKHALMALKKENYFGRIPEQRMREILRQKNASINKRTKIPSLEWTFEVALKKGNYFSDAYNHLGTIYLEKKEFNKSILAFKKTIEIYPKDARGHFNLGCAYWEIGKWEKAEEEWRKAIKYEKKLKEMKERGSTSEDQLDVSLIVLETYDSFKAHKYLGRLYIEKNLPDKALKEFEKAIDLEPNDPEPYYNMGKIYHKKSEQHEKFIDKSIFYFEKYLYLGGKKEEEVKKILKALKKIERLYMEYFCY
jgi:tetratricopeptide (TPR) repeat protein